VRAAVIWRLVLELSKSPSVHFEFQATTGLAAFAIGATVVPPPSAHASASAWGGGDTGHVWFYAGLCPNILPRLFATPI